jgi:hypothetical protein
MTVDNQSYMLPSTLLFLLAFIHGVFSATLLLFIIALFRGAEGARSFPAWFLLAFLFYHHGTFTSCLRPLAMRGGRKQSKPNFVL